MEDAIELRVSVLGDKAVGKTSLIHRFKEGTFQHETYPTMIDFMQVDVRVEGDTVRVTVIDNAGCEGYGQMLRSFNQRTDGLILVYDVTEKRTFNHLDSWLERIKDSCEDNVQIIVVGNKVDMHYYDREVSNEDIVNFAKDKKAVFMETSVLDNYNVNEVFFRLIKMILKAQGMLLPGCEDPVMSLKDRESVPVNIKNLKRAVVPRKKKNTDFVSVSNSNKPAPANSCC